MSGNGVSRRRGRRQGRSRGRGGNRDLVIAHLDDWRKSRSGGSLVPRTRGLLLLVARSYTYHALTGDMPYMRGECHVERAPIGNSVWCPAEVRAARQSATLSLTSGMGNGNWEGK